MHGMGTCKSFSFSFFDSPTFYTWINFLVLICVTAHENLKSQRPLNGDTYEFEFQWLGHVASCAYSILINYKPVPTYCDPFS